jgi:TetR/AcrR family transcriptional regulator, transcriptional repressor for nem operon
LAGGNKEKVVLAAMELFHRKGFQATGLEEILTQSGVCKSNFYYHFKSKDELGLFVLKQKMEEMLREIVMPNLGNRSLAPKERLHRFFEEMIRFCDAYNCRRGSIFGNMTLELAGHNEEMRQQVEMYFRHLEETVAAALQEGLDGGAMDLRGMEPGELAAAIVALLEGGILLSKGYKDSSPLSSGLKLLMYFIAEDHHREKSLKSGG